MFLNFINNYFNIKQVRFVLYRFDKLILKPARYAEKKISKYYDKKVVALLLSIRCSTILGLSHQPSIKYTVT